MFHVDPEELRCHLEELGDVVAFLARCLIGHGHTEARYCSMPADLHDLELLADSSTGLSPLSRS